jgi:hypothetical protein
LVTTALVHAAEAAATLIADDADGGNGGVAIVSSGTKLIPSFICC